MQTAAKKYPAGLTLDGYVEQILVKVPTATLTYRETWALKQYFEALQAKKERVTTAIKVAFGKTPVGVDGVLLVSIASYNRLVEELNT